MATGHVLIAPDKFKGSLTALGVADHLAAGLRAARPDLRLVTAPVADGGDGTLDATVAAGFRRVPVRVTGPTGRPVDAAIGVRGRCAVVELAAASGLVLLADDRLDPLRASSRGTGALLLAALDAGCTEIVLGVGGSACTDGGAGMLQALGASLLDASGEELAPGGAALAELDRVDLSTLDRRLRDTRVVLASDVDNPLLGPDGATRVYAPQKGASAADVALLEAGLTRWADAVDPGSAMLPGAGAAGGVGYAALTVLRAQRRPGIDVVLELVSFHDHLKDAALVITGEGALDEQTLHGKAPAGVAAAAREYGIPVVAVCGQRTLDDDRLAAAGILAAYPLTDLEPDVSRCLAEPGPLLERLAAVIARNWLAIAAH
jgi:glycerate kinase